MTCMDSNDIIVLGHDGNMCSTNFLVDQPDPNHCLITNILTTINLIKSRIIKS